MADIDTRNGVSVKHKEGKAKGTHLSKLPEYSDNGIANTNTPLEVEICPEAENLNRCGTLHIQYIESKSQMLLPMRQAKI